MQKRNHKRGRRGTKLGDFTFWRKFGNNGSILPIFYKHLLS